MKILSIISRMGTGMEMRGGEHALNAGKQLQKSFTRCQNNAQGND